MGNTGSEAGLGMIFNAAYSPAKEGIAGLTRTVAREQGRFGIRCNMIRPRASVNTGGGGWGRRGFQKLVAVAEGLGGDWIRGCGLRGVNRPPHPEPGPEFLVVGCPAAAPDTQWGHL